MRYQIIPRWIFLMLIVSGLAVGAGGLTFLVIVPPPAGVIVGVIWLAIGSAMTFFSMRGLRNAGDDDRLRRDGIAATATVLSTAKTHVTIDNVPQWAIRVRIDGLAAPYETTLKLLTHSPLADGARFGVRVDPLAHDHVVVAAAGDDGDDVNRAASEDDGDDGDVPVVDAGQIGLAAGETAAVNADGSRTITMVPATGSHDALAVTPADTECLLVNLDRLRANGSYTEAEYALVKAKLLGGDERSGSFSLEHGDR
jgi:hypothetical protein